MRMDSASGLTGRLRALLDQPELNVAIFGFLLSYPWEFLQMALYAVAPDTPLLQAIKMCSLGAVGDSAIMLTSYGVVAIFARSRWWILRPNARQIAAFVAIGVVITIGIESVATRSEGFPFTWRYATAMPVLPIVGAGLSPVLQWLILPPLALWFVRRQLGHVA